jgi:hypothetical protein
VRYPINSDGIDTRIAENNFIIAFGGRITLVGSPHISCQLFSNRGNLFQQFERQFMTLLLTLRTGLIISETIMPDTAADLFRQHIEKRSYRLSHAVAQVNRINLVSGKVARKQYFPQSINYINIGS